MFGRALLGAIDLKSLTHLKKILAVKNLRERTNSISIWTIQQITKPLAHSNEISVRAHKIGFISAVTAMYLQVVGNENNIYIEIIVVMRVLVTEDHEKIGLLSIILVLSNKKRETNTQLQMAHKVPEMTCTLLGIDLGLLDCCALDSSLFTVF